MNSRDRKKIDTQWFKAMEAINKIAEMVDSSDPELVQSVTTQLETLQGVINNTKNKIKPAIVDRLYRDIPTPQEQYAILEKLPTDKLRLLASSAEAAQAYHAQESLERMRQGRIRYEGAERDGLPDYQGSSHRVFRTP